MQNLHSNLTVFWNSIKLIQKFSVHDQTNHSKDLSSFEELTLKNVTVMSDNEDKKILENVNLTFKQQQKYAIIGRSGVGKTILIKLILKSIVPQKGELSYNGLDYSLLTTQDLLTKISFVSTEFGVFTSTLRDNITLFSEDTEEAKIKPLVQMFKLEHIKLDQEINENSISSGEKQRIALVRSLLEGKDFFILDEAFSNLDKNNQILAEEVFLKDSTKTVINVTHHLKNEDFYHSIINLEEQENV